MELISYSIFALLQMVALVHLGWAFGMAWPAKNREKLPMMVIGVPAGTAMPSTGLTILVTFAISGLGVLALWGAGIMLTSVFNGLKGWAMLGAAAIFGLRGIATYLPFGALQASVEPFRSLDRRYFAPLCLLLSAGFLAIYAANGLLV